MAKIIHFGKYYLPDSGGIESVTVSLAKGAVAAGHTVTVICFEKTPTISEEELDGVRVVRAPIAKLVASQPLSLKYFLKCLLSARGSDLVHLHAPNMLGAFCALFIGRKTRLLVHWHSDVVSKGWLGRLTRPLEWALLHRANCIVATSQVYADFSESLRSFKKKVKIVPIGVSDVKYAQVDMGLPPLIEERVSGREIILAVGRLVPYKGFEILIEAAKRLSTNVVVVIVGGGPLLEDLHKAVQTARCTDKVVLTGRLSDAVLHTLFGRATIYCMPSTNRAEAFGVVLLEAMASGLPIVATEILGSGVSWVNQHGVSGINVPTKDPVALANALDELLSNEILRNQLAIGARARYAAHFTEDKTVSLMLEVYKKVIGNSEKTITDRG